RRDLRAELLALGARGGVTGGGALEQGLRLDPGGPGEAAALGARGPAHPALGAELAGEPVRTLQDATAQDRGDGDAVPELHEQHALGVLAEVMLGEGCELDVVLDADGAAEPLFELGGEVEADEAGCGEALRDPAVRRDDAGRG